MTQEELHVEEAFFAVRTHNGTMKIDLDIVKSDIGVVRRDVAGSKAALARGRRTSP